MAAAGTTIVDQFKGCTILGWRGPILTDWAAFMWSLGSCARSPKEGVPRLADQRRSAVLSPEVSMQIQRSLNSDIVMQLDECTPADATYEQAQASMLMSRRWAQRSKDEFNKLDNPNALFGIVQGTLFEQLRADSLAGPQRHRLRRIAVGGLSVGESREDMHRILDFIGPKLPTDKPHYLMGVGTPEDLVYAVECGLDMFDCDAHATHAMAGCSRALVTSS